MVYACGSESEAFSYDALGGCEAVYPTKCVRIKTIAVICVLHDVYIVVQYILGCPIAYLSLRGP